MDDIRAHIAAQHFWADYTDAVDRRDFAALTRVLGDAEVTFPGAAGPLYGGAATADLYRRVLPAEPHGHHLVSNPRTRTAADGRTVTAECRYHFVDARTLRVEVLGRYRTRFVRQGDELRPLSHAVVREFAAETTDSSDRTERQ
jgi:hypothetical protein